MHAAVLPDKLLRDLAALNHNLRGKIVFVRYRSVIMPGVRAL